MGINHLLKVKKGSESEEDKAQTIALAQTLLRKYRRVIAMILTHQKMGAPTVGFYLQMIHLLGHYHEYDKLDGLIQSMNKDKIPFDGRMWIPKCWREA